MRGSIGISVVDFEVLRRFVVDLPELRQALQAPTSSSQELMLRSEVRRSMEALSGALLDAADCEDDRIRAAVLRAASAAASVVSEERDSRDQLHGS